MEHITINSDRSVTVPVELRKIGVQYDHNVNTIEFVGPRYSSNVDLSTMTIYINYILSDKTPGKYKAENVIIDDQDDSLIRFNWTITRNVTKVSGILSCLVCAKKTDEEGNEINHWNTDIFRLLSVSEGMENDLVIQEQYPDIITSLIQNVNEHDAKLLEFSGLDTRVTDIENNVNEHDAKLLEFSGLDTRVTDIENNVNELKDDLNGDTTETSFYSVEQGSGSASVLKCSTLTIKAREILKKITYYENSYTTSKVFFVVDGVGKILDKYSHSASQNGWEDVVINKSYSVDTYIAMYVNGMRLSYVSSEPSTPYFSKRTVSDSIIYRYK